MFEKFKDRMMWQEQIVSFSILPRFFPQLASREYKSSLFGLKSVLKKFKKITTNASHNQNLPEGTTLRIAKGENALCYSDFEIINANPIIYTYNTFPKELLACRNPPLVSV